MLQAFYVKCDFLTTFFYRGVCMAEHGILHCVFVLQIYKKPCRELPDLQRAMVLNEDKIENEEFIGELRSTLRGKYH